MADNLENSMVSEPSNPLLVEHTRILQALSAARIALKKSLAATSNAADKFNSKDYNLFIQNFAEARVLGRTALEILDDALPEK